LLNFTISTNELWQPENTGYVRYILSLLEADPHTANILAMMDQKVVSICPLLAYLAMENNLASYMELGVRRGFSMAMIAGRRPFCHLVGFDKWEADYGKAPNPGPDFVRTELAKVGYIGKLELITGDTVETLPQYKPKALFSLILVDADHTQEGVYKDILNAIHFLHPEGVMIVDDLQDKDVRAGFDRAVSLIRLAHWKQDRVGAIYFEPV